ncbi:hypothetical protein RND81_06G237200 [Saponaria officinalis]|uniref:Uncharacterized protein n=1 Tax=Saponaria officinalis TaxID=3572 RepID=A0AAW1KFW1_SAPOF
MDSVFPLFLMLLFLISSPFPSLSSEIQKFTATDDRAAKKNIGFRSPRLLDLVIRDYAVNLFEQMNYRTGELNNVPLPTNFSGIEVDIVKFRCGSLRRYGAKIKEFNLGKNLMINPCVERVIFIRQLLEYNFSDIYYDNYYNLQGYRLVTPVLGLLAYNGGDDIQNSSNPSPFEVRVMADGDPIKVDFTNVTRYNPKIVRDVNVQGKMLYCANFDKQGNVTITSMVAPNVCHINNQGHIGLVIETNQLTSRPTQGRSEEYTRRVSRWKVALGSSIGAGIGAFLLGLLFVAMFIKAKTRSKLEELVRRAYEEEALEVSMVGHVRAPIAPPTRTVPIIEHHYRPPRQNF